MTTTTSCPVSMFSRNCNLNPVIGVRRRWSWCMRSSLGRTKALLLGVLFVSLSISGFAGEALGIGYEEVYLVRLKHPEASKKKAEIFREDGKPTPMVEGAFKVPSGVHEQIDGLFQRKADFNHGKADSRLQLYSLVFYKGGKSVLTITPNLAGGDLYASDVKGYDPRSLSSTQRGEFMDIVFRSLANLIEGTELPSR